MLDSLRLTMYKRRLRVIIWDLDGTLYTSRDASNAIKKRYVHYLISHQLLPREQAETELDKHTNTTGSWSASMSRLSNKSEKYFIQLIENTVPKHHFVLPNAPLVKKITTLTRYRHIILTNSTTQNTLRVLGAIGFPVLENQAPPFEALFTLEQNKYIKPDVRIFQRILQYTDEPPQAHLMVGDMVTSDILPAKKVNIKTALLGSCHHDASYSFISIAYLLEALTHSH